MKVLSYLNKIISDDGAAHLTLIDPDEQGPESAGKMASQVASAGTDGIMVGGSTGVEGDILDETISRIKRNTDLPTILFPPNENGISREADAIFFMSLLNSRDVFFISRAQKNGAPLVKEFELEPISLAYLIVEPGGTVGKIGKADLISKDDVKTAVAYSLSSQFLGMKCVYLEAGSGAEDPVPVEMVREVRESVDSILLVGGGIRTPKLASKRVEAGADVVVTGTMIEEAEDKLTKVGNLIEAIKE